MGFPFVGMGSGFSRRSGAQRTLQESDREPRYSCDNGDANQQRDQIRNDQAQPPIRVDTADGASGAIAAPEGRRQKVRAPWPGSRPPHDALRGSRAAAQSEGAEDRTTRWPEAYKPIVIGIWRFEHDSRTETDVPALKRDHGHDLSRADQ